MGGERRSITVSNGDDVNMFDLGASNYDDLFAYDSLVLGQRNERRAQAMTDAYDPKCDVFSVIGCSLCATDIAGGNAALALGRAGRVREALLFVGVDRERILDEGCWSEEEGATNLPTRGVIPTLKRRRG